jgi:hypothetical protein
VVNGKAGKEFIQKSGVGQGDPLSAFRFNIGTEPLLRALHKHTGHCTYQDTAGTFIHPSAYADDHLHIISVRAAQDVEDIMNIYNKYTAVSGLRINPAKTELLAINTPKKLIQDIQAQTGISTVETLTLLGIKLANTLQGCINATYEHIDTKAIVRQMRISTQKSTHVAQKATDTGIPIANVCTRVYGTRKHRRGKQKDNGHDTFRTVDTNGRTGVKEY